MIIVSNTTAQTLAPGQALVFDNVVWQSGCNCNPNEYFRNNSPLIQVRPGCYDVKMGANIGGTVAAAPVQLSIALDGSALPTTTASQTPAAITDFNNVSRSTLIRVPNFTSASVSLINSGTSTVVVAANSTLEVARRG